METRADIVQYITMTATGNIHIRAIEVWTDLKVKTKWPTPLKGGVRYHLANSAYIRLVISGGRPRGAVRSHLRPIWCGRILPGFRKQWRLLNCYIPLLLFIQNATFFSSRIRLSLYAARTLPCRAPV